MLFDTPVRVLATPLAWLRAFGEGCCVLDWDAFLPLYLRGKLQVSDPALADRLRRALTSPPAPFEIRLEAA